MKASLLFLIILYLLIVSIHLYACYVRIEGIRRITKVLLMPLIGIIYYHYTPKEKFIKKIFIAEIFGFLGDAFFLYISNFFMMILGIATFFIGHIFYILSFIKETGLKNYKKYFYFLIIITIIYFAYIKLLYDNLIDGFERGKVIIPGICYLLILAILNVTSGVYAFTYLNIFSILIHIGTFIFSVSDFILVRQMFYENKKYYQVIMMATYILAQSLICIGMANKPMQKEKGKIL